MESSKRIKKWKSFDFGPPLKKSNNSMEKEVLKVVLKESRTKAVKRSTSTNTFNFHEKLRPRCIKDLAVHPKKIGQVEEWIKGKLPQESSVNPTPFLLISGPTGSGKTATVYVICQTLDISVSEWTNPLDQEYEHRELNQIDQFLEFLSESRYGSLFESSDQRVTLIKDFPNAVIRNPEQFFDILEFCKCKTRQPIIFICTETASSKLNLQRTLFPDNILNKYDITHISFNASAPSLIKIALARAKELVKSNFTMYNQPSSKVIDAIVTSADGDIRIAINQFYIAATLGCEDLPTSKLSGNKTSKKRTKQEVKLNGMSKDQNLGLFHGLGRVLNPKKMLIGNSWRIQHSVETLVDEFMTQPQMFISFLFRNYLNYFGNVTDASKSAEFLSLSATLLEYWYNNETLTFALWISVMGLMIFNENRVSKWNQIAAPYKINKTRSKEEDWSKPNPVDFFYYNVINNSGKYHRFQFNM